MSDEVEDKCEEQMDLFDELDLPPIAPESYVSDESDEDCDGCKI